MDKDSLNQEKDDAFKALNEKLVRDFGSGFSGFELSKEAFDSFFEIEKMVWREVVNDLINKAE